MLNTDAINVGLNTSKGKGGVRNKECYRKTSMPGGYSKCTHTYMQMDYLLPCGKFKKYAKSM